MIESKEYQEDSEKSEKNLSHSSLIKDSPSNSKHLESDWISIDQWERYLNEFRWFNSDLGKYLP